MKIKYLLSLLIITTISISSFAKDEMVLKVAPIVGYGYCWLDATSTYGETEIDAEGITTGVDISLGRVFSEKYTIGVDFDYQVMEDPEVTIGGDVVDDFDITLTTVKLGPFIRYFLSEDFYLSFSFGYSSFWSAGGDDMMDPAANGVSYSLGAGYDYWINDQFGVCLFIDAVAHYTWAEDDGVDFFVQNAYLPNIGIAGCLKF